MLNRFYLRLYLHGLSGGAMPRRLRRLIARTGAHRAWLMGHLGYFEQDGITFGPAHRYQDWRDDPEAELRKLWTEQGVSSERQDALIAEINEKAQPGTRIGPFVLGQPDH